MSVEIVCLPRGKVKSDGSTWCYESDDVLSWDVHVWRPDDEGAIFGWNMFDEIKHLPCKRSAELIALHFCVKYDEHEFRWDWRLDEGADREPEFID